MRSKLDITENLHLWEKYLTLRALLACLFVCKAATLINPPIRWETYEWCVIGWSENAQPNGIPTIELGNIDVVLKWCMRQCTLVADLNFMIWSFPCFVSILRSFFFFFFFLFGVYYMCKWFRWPCCKGGIAWHEECTNVFFGVFATTRAIKTAEVGFSHLINAGCLTVVRKTLRGRKATHFQKDLPAQVITPPSLIETGDVRPPSHVTHRSRARFIYLPCVQVRLKLHLVFYHTEVAIVIHLKRTCSKAQLLDHAYLNRKVRAWQSRPRKYTL